MDGLTENGRAIFEAKFMLPWSFSEEAAAAKHMPQLQHNMAVAGRDTARLSILTGGGKWVLITADADPIYQEALLEAELRFWDCVKSGTAPRPIGAPPPLPKAEIIRIADMSGSNEWAVLAPQYRDTKRPKTITSPPRMALRRCTARPSRIDRPGLARQSQQNRRLFL